jgi:hypothetical protein
MLQPHERALLAPKVAPPAHLWSDGGSRREGGGPIDASAELALHRDGAIREHGSRVGGRNSFNQQDAALVIRVIVPYELAFELGDLEVLVIDLTDHPRGSMLGDRVESALQIGRIGEFHTSSLTHRCNFRKLPK